MYAPRLGSELVLTRGSTGCFDLLLELQRVGSSGWPSAETEQRYSLLEVRMFVLHLGCVDLLWVLVACGDFHPHLLIRAPFLRMLTIIGREKRASIMRVVRCPQLSVTSNDPNTEFRALTDLKRVLGVVVEGVKGDSKVWLPGLVRTALLRLWRGGGLKDV